MKQNELRTNYSEVDFLVNSIDLIYHPHYVSIRRILCVNV